jgi:vacuolar-type H+-ATPase subunit I/STV1
MQEQMLPRRKQPYPSIVKAYPRSKLYRLMVNIWGFISALGWLALIFSLFVEHGAFLILFILSSICTVLLCMWAIIDHSWECCEENRQAAAQGDQRLLADVQPVSDAQALPLPTTIGMRPSWGGVIAFTACLFFMGLLISYWKLWALGTFSLISVLVMVSPWLIFAVYFLAVYYARTRKRITLTEHGITLAGISPKIQSIP